MTRKDLQRDRRVTRATHKLFWKASTNRPIYFYLTIALHLPALTIIHVIIPVLAALGIQAIVKEEFNQVAVYASAIVISMFISQVIISFGTLAFDRLGTYAGSYVQKAVFNNFLNKDYDFYSNQFIGGLGAQAARLRDAVEEYDRIMVFETMKAFVIIAAGLIVIATQSLELAFWLFVGVAFIILGTTYIAKLRIKYRRKLSLASNELANVLGDGLSHGATVKSYSKENYEMERINKPLNNWVKAQLLTWDSSIPHTFIRHMLLAFTMAGLLLVSSNLYQSGAISIATVALVQLYIVRVATATLEIGDNIKKYEMLMSNAYEPVATMLIPSSVKDPALPKTLGRNSKYDVRFNNVSFVYPEGNKSKKAISDFSLEVKSGEKVGLVGYSGGGKSTLTKLLLRFMDVTSGSITINNIDIKDLRQSELRENVSYVPQEPLLFHRSIKDNVQYSKPNSNNAEFINSVKVAYVEEFVDELPNGYDTLVGERGVKLSGGQRQRVAVARAILKKSPILVLDEATSALDSQSEQYIQKALWELMKDRTAIVIAHRLSTIQKMDRIIVLDKGKIAQQGTHAELLKADKGIYAKLWAHQSGGYIA